MKFREFLTAKAVTLCFLGIGAVVLAVLLAFAEVGPGPIALAELLLTLLVAAWLVTEYLRQRARLRRLQRLCASLPEPYLLGEVLPRPHDPVERQYYEAMKTVSRSAIGIAEQARREKEEYCDYVESWIHELKTPLTACSLILSNGGDPHKLRRELKRADNLTESILYYARLRTAEKDLQLREVQVSAAIDEAVQSQMELLIAAGISVQVEGDFHVYTDEKPLCFILKQLLINCAKYCAGCRVEITARDGCITVRDNGPGIVSQDLSRVTERGFTGVNGRARGGSTGMGLFIVRALCETLGIALEITSRHGEYTCVALRFASLTKA